MSQILKHNNSSNPSNRGLTKYSNVVDQQVSLISENWSDIYSISNTTEPLQISAYRFSLLSGSYTELRFRILADVYGTSLDSSHKIFPFDSYSVVNLDTDYVLKSDIFIPENHTLKLQVSAIGNSSAIINLDYLSIIKNSIYNLLKNT